MRVEQERKTCFPAAEEGVGGALPMIEDGILENPHVDAAFALHVEPLEKTGNIQVKDGSIMASPDDFKIDCSRCRRSRLRSWKKQ